MVFAVLFKTSHTSLQIHNVLEGRHIFSTESARVSLRAWKFLLQSSGLYVCFVQVYRKIINPSKLGKDFKGVVMLKICF